MSLKKNLELETQEHVNVARYIKGTPKKDLKTHLETQLRNLNLANGPYGARPKGVFGNPKYLVN